VGSYKGRLAVVAVIFLVSLSVGVLVTQEGGRVPLQAERLAQAGGVYEFAWAPDNSAIAYVSSTSSGFDLWTIGIPGGRPRQITATQRYKRTPRWSTDGKWIAYVAMQENGRGDIHLVSPDGSSSAPLAQTSADEIGPVWSPDSREIAFVERTSSGSRIMAMEVQTRALREIAAIDASDLHWSPDGRHIAFVADPLQSRRDERDNKDIFIVPASGGPPRLLTPGTPRFRDVSPSWSPDSRQIVYVSEETGFSNLYIVDVENGEQRALTAGKADALTPRWSPDGARVAYVRNENFLFHVFTIDVETGRTNRISDRDGVNGGFSHDESGPPRPQTPSGSLVWSSDGTRLAFTHSDPTRTSDVWIATLGQAPAQLTNSMPQELRREGRFVWPEALNYRSFDGREIAALVFKPRGSQPRAGYPALLVFRDTVDGQHAAGWDPFVQFFVSNGYLVFAPNVRGSSGQGRDYRHLITGNGGDHDVRDAFFGLDRLSSEGLIDTERLGVFGAGTGGYLATTSLVRDEARFKAAVCLYGIVDAVTAASYPGMAEWSRYMIGGTPIENPRPYFQRSIINFIDKLRTPIVFLYAGNDTSAPFQQLQQFAVQAEVKGKWFDYRVFENELGDWRTWQASTVRMSLEAMNALFEKHLLGRDREIRLSRNR
jgi:dipeptidyl aminopeptidase/acylaminoacyl peptidase